VPSQLGRSRGRRAQQGRPKRLEDR
jgi:hypothetical protein